MQALPRVFFDISIGPRYCGKLVFQLNRTIAPRTVDNFVGLCTGKREFGYKNSKIHKIVPGEGIYGGDLTQGDGTGRGLSINGQPLALENASLLLHSKRGVLSMVSTPGVGILSQFVLSTNPLSKFDGRNQVIGELVDGFAVLDVIASVGDGASNRPLVDVVITNCGYHQPIQEPELNPEDYE